MEEEGTSEVELTAEQLCQLLRKNPNCMLKSLVQRHHSEMKSPCIRKEKDIVLVDQADVEIIKLQFMGMMVDISIGQHGGLCTLDLMNHINDNVIKQNNLLKRSIILLKAWMTYEGSLLGSQLACMATYGLYTLCIYIFNNYSRDSQGRVLIANEMQFLKKFFSIFGNFDWQKYMVTIYGPVREQNFYERLRDEFGFDMQLLAINERMQYFGHSSKEETLSCLLIKPDELKPYVDKYSALRVLGMAQKTLHGDEVFNS